MKKITFVLTFLAVLNLNAKNCLADSYKYVPYAGFGYDYSKTQIGQVRPAYHSGTVYIGSEYGSYFSTEMFFSQSLNRTNGQNPTKLKSSYRAYGLDLMGYLPLGCSQKFSLLATTGIGEYAFKLKTGDAKRSNEHGYGYRFGGGVKYAFNTHWQTRFITRYVKFDRVDSVNQAIEYSLNLEYHF